MAELMTLARPYAKAVFELAAEAPDRKKAFVHWSEVLAALAVAATDPQVGSWLAHPGLNEAEFAAALEASAGHAIGHQGVNLLRLLAENGKISVLPAVAEQYEALRAAAERRVEVAITTAADVAPAQRDVLSAAIAKRLDREVEVSWQVDAALIGGAIIRADDTVIDASVSGELEQLRHTLAA